MRLSVMVLICVLIGLVSLNLAVPAHPHNQVVSPEVFNFKTPESQLTPIQLLGKKLFIDRNLSTPPGQACMDCHAPGTGFANPNPDFPDSQGVLKDRFGNRNDLPAGYAAFSPDFHYDQEEELYVGGQFWDGRAKDLIEQAKGPFLNPLEMGNPDEKTVVDKIKQSDYADLFGQVFGEKAFDDPLQDYHNAAVAIAEFEKTKEFSPFTSKYDYYLKGKASFTAQELRGLKLFDAEDKGNCAACHPSQTAEDGSAPLFTDFTYDNLGAPKNAELPFYYLPEELNPDGVNFVDRGLGGALEKPEEYGKFKVPSLRNLSKTGPYLHNGFFKNIRQVVSFYNTRDVGPWPEPEVKENINTDELGDLGLTEQEVDDITAFVLTLTDGYQSTGAYKLQWEKGNSWYMEMTSDQNQSQSIMDTVTDYGVVVTKGITINVSEVNPDGSAWLNYTLDRIAAQVDSSIVATKKYDSAIDIEKPSDPELQDYFALKGQSFAVNMTPQGNVNEIKGMDQLYDSYVKNVELPPGFAADDYLEQIVEQMTEESVAIYPDTPVNIGDTWIRKIAINQGVPLDLDLDSTFTLKDRRDGIAFINVVTDIKNQPGAVMEMTGMAAYELKFNGRQQGTIELDEKTGWLRKSTIDLNISTTVLGMMEPLLWTFGLKTTVTFKKIK